MKVCVFGLGRIGLPIALVCADSGFLVTGIDVNHTLLETLRAGKIPFNEPGMQDLLDKHLGSGFVPKHPQNDDITGDLQRANYLMLTVGTGFAKFPEKPNLSTLYTIVGQLIATSLKGKTIILRVTLPIGTADDVVATIEKKTGLTEGKDFWFAFVPERIMEGKAVEEERSLPKIIGARSDGAFKRVSDFFEKIGGESVRVSNPRTAEFVKLIDNSWRNTKFAFANELAVAAEQQAIDVMEAINCANRGYERNQIPIPGPVSGYCLGKDPYILENAFQKVAAQRGFQSLWFYGRLANDWLIEKIAEDITEKQVLVAGLSFKSDIDDYRYSHSIELARRLVDKGCQVYVHDPFLDENPYTMLPNDLINKVTKVDNIEDMLDTVGAVIIATPHSQYRKLDISQWPDMVRIVDLWSIFRGKAGGNNYAPLGAGTE